jgi:mannose-6-phosphate isomerase-like protein (cupin superfamily)
MGLNERTEIRCTSSANAADGWFLEQVAATAFAPATFVGRTTLVERRATRRGVMPPLHSHREDETYYILSGELSFYVGDEVVRAAAGDMVVAPRNVPRTYRVESAAARWLVLTRAVSVTRFEDFGLALAEPPADGSGDWWDEVEEEAVKAIAGVNGITVLGPPGKLPTDL